METKEITKIEIYKLVTEFILNSKDIETIKWILLDTLDNSKEGYYLAEDAYYTYIKK